jgi:tryptophan-rich sensory protein
MLSARRFALFGFLVVAFVAGGIGSAATFENVRSWYPSLQKPHWTPPNWLFGPVWTCLYVAMAIATWRVWRKAGTAAARIEILLYLAQITLNLLWSILFFGLRSPLLGLIDIVALWTLLFTLQLRYLRRDQIAALLWLPYLLWVSFATALNAAIWWLNR